ncbi:type II secretion system F family protein [Halorubellus litoreus]|uniref:Type II secretion system F family protein n=1 Tax=Halorubellus litoreus TaxID=755308 RepID=A0ABD5VLC2_9EURY
MSTPGATGETASTPMPDYEVSQYFPRSRDMTPEERRELRDQYGVTRAYFKARPEEYRDVQRWLNQARIGTTYDIYLSRSVILALVAGVLAALLGVVLSLVLSNLGVLGGLESPFSFPAGIAGYIEANKLLFTGGALTLGLGIAAGATTWFVRYYYPRNIVDTRERAINVMLPHAITYMYAMSYGGTNLVEVFRSLSEAEDTYGEVAAEFDMIVRDMELFGNDMFTALRNARNLTPSGSLERFLDDLVSVVDSGGDVTTFFEDQAARYAETANEEQEDFLETLSVLSEIFIVGFVAAPLFLIVTLMVISFLGGSTVNQMAVLVYAGLPLGMIGFLVFLDVLSAPFVQPAADELDDGRSAPLTPDDVDDDDERFEAYAKDRQYERYYAIARDPLAAVREHPLYTLAVTVPLALVYLAVVSALDVVPVSIGAFTTTPVMTTTVAVVAPLLLVLVPLSYFHEGKRRRENAMVRRFPEVLNVLSSANYMGIPFVDALGLVSRWSKGALAEDLRALRNDIEWNYDVTAALLAFGNRMHVPYLTRTVKLIAEGGRTSGDMSRILAIAAEDTRARYRIERSRRRAMGSYIAIVVIGYLVYLMVIVLVAASFLGPIAEAASAPTASNVPQSSLPVSFTNIPLDTYRALFYHSVLVMAVGSGLLAGKLADNSTLSGLKYSILMIVLGVAAFMLV